MIKVCILDYGSGNVQSVRNLLQHLKVKSTISKKNKVIQDSTHIILPGVGAFGEAIKKLRKNIDINFPHPIKATLILPSNSSSFVFKYII